MMARKFRIPAVFLVLLSAQIFFFSCNNTPFEKEKYGNCEDRIQNQGEESPDCGGPCMPCASCNDGEKNGTETGIDCGGICISCTPPCSIPDGTAEMVLHPPNFSAAYQGNAIVDDSYYSSFTDYLSCSNSPLKLIRFSFKDKFDLFKTIPLNQTMVFTTATGSQFDLRSNSEVIVSYRATFGFEDYSGTFERGQRIYFHKISDKAIRVTICALNGSRGDVISANGLFKQF